MKGFAGVIVAASVTVAMPASAAVERYSCAQPGKTPTVLDIDTSTRMFNAAEGSARSMPICQQFAEMIVAGMDASKAAAVADFRTIGANCPIGISDNQVVADFSGRTSNIDTTTLIVFDRSEMTLRITGRLFRGALGIVAPCKRL